MITLYKNVHHLMTLARPLWLMNSSLLYWIQRVNIESLSLVMKNLVDNCVFYEMKLCISFFRAFLLSIGNSVSFDVCEWVKIFLSFIIVSYKWFYDIFLDLKIIKFHILMNIKSYVSGFPLLTKFYESIEQQQIYVNRVMWGKQPDIY